MLEEARLEPVESGLTPVTAGWFVVNTRDAAWMNNHATQACCIFESDDFVLRGRPDLSEYVKPDAGFVLRVLRPGRPALRSRWCPAGLAGLVFVVALPPVRGGFLVTSEGR